MLYGRVTGQLTAARKAEALSGYKLLLVSPHTKSGGGSGMGELGNPIVAVDLLGAGVGEEVIVAFGRAARMAIGKETLPIEAAVIGIVDPSGA